MNRPTTRSARTRALGIGTAVLALGAAVACEPRGLDPAVGDGGIVVAPISETTNDRYMGIVATDDGGAYATGFTTLEGGDQAIVISRFDAAGALDPSFGTGGTTTVNATPGGSNIEVARAIDIHDDGSVVVAGIAEHDPTAAAPFNRDTDVVVVKVDAAGEPVATFGDAGVARLDLGTATVINDSLANGDNGWGIAALPGGRTVAFGATLDANNLGTDFVLAGIDETGELDAGFGVDGLVLANGGGTEFTVDNPRNLLYEPDTGRLVTSGYSSYVRPEGLIVQPVFVRTDLDGQLDPTFGEGGVAANFVPGLTTTAESYTLDRQADGKYVSTGYGRNSSSEQIDMILTRYLPNGELDSTFGTQGARRINVHDVTPGDDRGRNLVVAPDDTIFAVGSARSASTNTDALIVRVAQNGKNPMGTWGTQGILTSDLGGQADAWFGSDLSDDGEHIWVAGYRGAGGGIDEDAAVARISLVTEETAAS